MDSGRSSAKRSAAISKAGSSMKLLTWWSDATSDSTSLRIASSPAHALSRNASRSSTPNSDAASARSMIFCQRSGVISVTLSRSGEFSMKISLGPTPLPLHGHRGNLHNLGGFVDTQPAKESQLDHLALAGIK